MKSRHVIKQGLRCLHGVLCLKLCYHYSSGKAARQYHGNGAADSVVLGSGYRNCSVACRLARAVAQQPPAVNGQDERFAPLTAAARRAFWQTRRASTACVCPPVHILALVFNRSCSRVRPVLGRTRRCCLLPIFVWWRRGSVCVKQGLGTALPNKILMGRNERQAKSGSGNSALPLS